MSLNSWHGNQTKDFLLTSNFVRLGMVYLIDDYQVHFEIEIKGDNPIRGQLIKAIIFIFFRLILSNSRVLSKLLIIYVYNQNFYGGQRYWMGRESVVSGGH